MAESKVKKIKHTGMKELTAKQRSALATQAVAGEDIGKKGKTFDKVASIAATQYGSEEAGQRVAAAAMMKARAARGK
jgi:hypothetical protein